MTFVVGDRVRSVVDLHGVKKGEEGVVQSVSGDGSGSISISVRWDEHNPRRHNNIGMCEKGHGWMVSRNHIEHIFQVDFVALPEVDHEASAFLLGL